MLNILNKNQCGDYRICEPTSQHGTTSWPKFKYSPLTREISKEKVAHDQQTVERIMQNYNEKQRKIRSCKKIFEAFKKWRNNLLNP